jgi:hypothetical protein
LIALKNAKESFNNQSDYDRRRKYKLVESIRKSSNTIHKFFDAMEEEHLETLEDRSNE